MSLETFPRPQQMEEGKNGNGSIYLSQREKSIHELVLKDLALRNHDDPTVNFAMSPELRKRYIRRREELCNQLGLSADEQKRNEAIKTYGEEAKEIAAKLRSASGIPPISPLKPAERHWDPAPVYRLPEK